MNKLSQGLWTRRGGPRHDASTRWSTSRVEFGRKPRPIHPRIRDNFDCRCSRPGVRGRCRLTPSPLPLDPIRDPLRGTSCTCPGTSSELGLLTILVKETPRPCRGFTGLIEVGVLCLKVGISLPYPPASLPVGRPSHWHNLLVGGASRLLCHLRGRLDSRHWLLMSSRYWRLPIGRGCSLLQGRCWDLRSSWWRRCFKCSLPLTVRYVRCKRRGAEGLVAIGADNNTKWVVDAHYI